MDHTQFKGHFGLEDLGTWRYLWSIPIANAVSWAGGLPAARLGYVTDQADSEQRNITERSTVTQEERVCVCVYVYVPVYLYI